MSDFLARLVARAGGSAATPRPLPGAHVEASPPAPPIETIARAENVRMPSEPVAPASEFSAFPASARAASAANDPPISPVERGAGSLSARAVPRIAPVPVEAPTARRAEPPIAAHDLGARLTIAPAPFAPASRAVSGALTPPPTQHPAAPAAAAGGLVPAAPASPRETKRQEAERSDSDEAPVARAPRNTVVPRESYAKSAPEAGRRDGRPTPPLDHNDGSGRAQREASLRARVEESIVDAPTVHVTIGRIEVRAVTDNAPPPAPARPGPAAPRLSLDQYLRERSEGRR